MGTMTTHTSAEDRARQLLDARMNSVRALVDGQGRIEALRNQMADAEREHARLYTAALNDGWTATELKTIGLAEPDKTARVKRRANAKPARQATPTSAHTSHDDQGESRPPQPES